MFRLSAKICRKINMFEQRGQEMNAFTLRSLYADLTQFKLITIINEPLNKLIEFCNLRPGSKSIGGKLCECTRTRTYNKN